MPDVITFCKYCAAALDETKQVCSDCGKPNPWAEPHGNPFLEGNPLVETETDQQIQDEDGFLQRSLFFMGGICLFGTFWAGFALLGGWSSLSATHKGILIVGPLLVSAFMFLFRRADLWAASDSRLRRIVRVLITVGGLAFAAATLWMAR